MELILTFKEKEIRELYDKSFEALNSEIEGRTKERNKTTYVLLGLTLFFCELTYFHVDWIYYAMISVGIAFLFTLWTWIINKKHRKEMKVKGKEVDDFLTKYRTIENIKYIYDDETIKYFESGRLKTEIIWSDIMTAVFDEKWIYVVFKSPRQNIWIPRITVDKDELKPFVNTINRKLNKANSELIHKV